MDDSAIPSSLFAHELLIIPEGNGESDRVGRKITIKNIHVKGLIKLAAATAATDTSDQVTCMLVQDTQTNGIQFAANILLDTDAFDSFRNLANSKRFKILYKRVVTLKAGGAAPSGAAFVFSEDVKTLNVNVATSIPIEYDNSANTGVITSVRTNNVYWVTQSESAVTGIIATARIRYTDN